MAKRNLGDVNVELYFKDGSYNGRVSSKKTGVIYKFNWNSIPKGFRNPTHVLAYDRVAAAAMKRARRLAPDMFGTGKLEVNRSR